MNISELVGWTGEYKMLVIDAVTGKVKREIKVKNLITYDGENLMRDALLGLETDLKINYFALGDGNAAPTKNDSQLDNEFFRKSTTSTAQDGNGEAINIVQIGANEANQLITELAAYAQGTGTLDTGVMISRILFLNDTKTSSEIIQIRRKDTIKGV